MRRWTLELVRAAAIIAAAIAFTGVAWAGLYENDELLRLTAGVCISAIVVAFVAFLLD